MEKRPVLPPGYFYYGPNAKDYGYDVYGPACQKQSPKDMACLTAFLFTTFLIKEILELSGRL
jgi:hypothetical protein